MLCDDDDGSPMNFFSTQYSESSQDTSGYNSQSGIVPTRKTTPNGHCCEIKKSNIIHKQLRPAKKAFSELCYFDAT